MNDITDAEQTVLNRIMTASRNEDVIEKEAKAVARKIRQRRKMTASGFGPALQRVRLTL